MAEKAASSSSEVERFSVSRSDIAVVGWFTGLISVGAPYRLKVALYDVASSLGEGRRRGQQRHDSSSGTLVLMPRLSYGRRTSLAAMAGPVATACFFRDTGTLLLWTRGCGERVLRECWQRATADKPYASTGAVEELEPALGTRFSRPLSFGELR